MIKKHKVKYLIFALINIIIVILLAFTDGEYKINFIGLIT